MSNISLVGSEIVVAKLLALPGNIRAKVERDAIRKINKVLVDRVKSSVPVESGALKKSIGAVIRKYNGGQVVVGIVGPKMNFAGNVVASKRGRKSFKRGKKSGSGSTFRRPAKYATWSRAEPDSGQQRTDKTEGRHRRSRLPEK